MPYYSRQTRLISGGILHVEAGSTLKMASANAGVAESARDPAMASVIPALHTVLHCPKTASGLSACVSKLAANKTPDPTAAYRLCDTLSEYLKTPSQLTKL